MVVCILDPCIPEVHAIDVALGANEGTGQKYSPTHWLDKVFKIGCWKEDGLSVLQLAVLVYCPALHTHTPNQLVENVHTLGRAR